MLVVFKRTWIGFDDYQCVQMLVWEQRKLFILINQIQTNVLVQKQFCPNKQSQCEKKRILAKFNYLIHG